MADPVPDPGPPPLRTLPHVRGLLVAEFTSSMGSTMALLGIAYLSYDDSKSVLHTVLVSAAYSLPMAVLGMFAGRLSQRTSRRLLLLWCYAAKSALYLVMAVLAARGDLLVPGLMVSSVLAGIVSAFTTPTWMSYERDLIPADRLAEANGSFGSVAAAAGLAGSLVGGALMGAIGVWSVFVADALSYAPFLWVVFRARVAERTSPPATTVSLRRTTEYVRRTPPLWQAFGRIALLSALVAPVAQLLPAIAAEINRSQATLGLVTALYGSGSMAVAFVIGRLERRFGSQRVIDLCFAATTVVLLGLGVLGGPVDGAQLWLLFGASLIPLGLLLSLGQSVISSVVQVQVQPGLEGPVFALYAIVYTVVAPLGGFALGWIADTNTVWTAVTSAGVAMLVLTGVLLGLLRGDRRRSAASGAGPDPLHSRPHLRFRLHHAQVGTFPVTHLPAAPPGPSPPDPSPPEPVSRR